jgi:mitochondrial cardiolipin hydrolase
MDEMLRFFDAALADNRLTRTEVNALRQCLEEADPDFDDLNVLRAKLFGLVGEKLSATNYRDLFAWLEEALKLLMRQLKPSGAETVSACCFSPGVDCRDAIVTRIRRARRLIRICVFTISDDVISREIQAAYERGVSVAIVTDNDKTADLGSDVARLANAGISVFIDRTSNHMHHKFAVIDHQWVLSGSFNWTRSATAYNHENLIVTNDKGLVVAFDDAFERLLKEMIPFESHHSKRRE